MSAGGYKIIDQGGMLCKLCSGILGRCFYPERLQRYSNRKFTALPERKRVSSLWMVYYE